MGFSLVTSFPDICNIQCLCYKWGLKDLPNFKSEWWCEGVCCCYFNNCGFNEFWDTQICCLGPCKLTSPKPNVTVSIPEFCVINCLCYKYGCQKPPDCLKEDCVVEKCCCCHYEFGLKDLLNIFQLFCLKLETGVKVGV